PILSLSGFLFFLMTPRPPRSTLFPYTTSSDLPALCVDADKAYEAIVAEKDDAKRTAATNRMIELVAKSWIAVPIVEGMGTWAVNPKSVGYFKPIPGRHEFGDVTERMPRPEAKPWP